MMTGQTDDLLDYATLRGGAAARRVKLAEVPVEHSVSLPLPTRRWSTPGYASFAGPAVRRPGAPMRLDLPDRWWLVEPRRGGLVTYSLTSAVPFAELTGGAVTLEPVGRSIAQLQEDLKLLDDLMDAAAPAFLRGTEVEPTARQDLLAALVAQLPAAILPWYQALVPDFFGWLEGAGVGDA